MLLRKDVYSYEYINIWERFDETSLPDKEDFVIVNEFGRYYGYWL